MVSWIQYHLTPHALLTFKSVCKRLRTGNKRNCVSCLHGHLAMAGHSVDQRNVVSLVIALDASLSMKGEKLSLVKHAVRHTQL